ncbi:MAG: XdhC family protein [Spirochaetaceae bacterium]|nr:XdhC family protein [Spirochaetaceae bacterium]
MNSKYFKFLNENLSRPLERRTIIEKENLGCEALYDIEGNFLISSTENVQITDGNYLSEILVGKMELVVCGGGHVGQAVYSLALFLGMNVTIIEDREEYCNKELYPTANLKIGKYDEVLSSMDLAHSAIVVATRGHKFDRTCVATALPKPYKYLGMIGSKGKVAKTMELLKNDINNKIIDSTVEKLNKIYSPIGLDINAQTPEEIAVSILAEVLRVTKANKREIQMKLSDLEKVANLEEPFVVARIIDKKGSAPREVGSYLAISKKENLIGTVGGGAVEAVVIINCNKMLMNDTKTSALFEHDLSNENASNLGMICGGTVKIILNKFIS